MFFLHVGLGEHVPIYDGGVWMRPLRRVLNVSGMVFALLGFPFIGGMIFLGSLVVWLGMWVLYAKGEEKKPSYNMYFVSHIGVVNFVIGGRGWVGFLANVVAIGIIGIGYVIATDLSNGWGCYTSFGANGVAGDFSDGLCGRYYDPVDYGASACLKHNCAESHSGSSSYLSVGISMLASSMCVYILNIGVKYESKGV
jgi:hypothetical protein